MKDRVTSESFSDLIPFSRALFGEFESSSGAATEALALATLTRRSPGGASEKAARALVDRAAGIGPEAIAPFLVQPFFRLSPRARFLLSAVDQAKWSYERVAVTLDLSLKELESALWEARFRLATSAEVASTEAARFFHSLRRGVRPPGLADSRVTCPDWDAASPWTQRWLDNEARPSEKPYLTKHVPRCEACRVSVERTREIMMLSESLLPMAWGEDSRKNLETALLGTWTESQEASLRAPKSITRNLQSFFSRNREAKFLAFLLIAIWIWALFQSSRSA